MNLLGASFRVSRRFGGRACLSLLVALPACSPATPPASAAATETRPAPAPEPPRKDPLAGLSPCAKDTPEGTGCAAKPHPAAAAPTPDSDEVWKASIGPDDPVLGEKNAPVTIVVFSDFECPFCRKSAAMLDELRASYPRDVRIVWKDLPLPTHPHAEAAAELARVARAQLGDAGFWKAHARLYASQQDFGDAGFHAIADELGLAWADVRAAIRTTRFGKVIEAGVAESDTLDVPATPTFFINGRKVVGAQPLEVVRPIVDAELVKARARLASGTRPESLYDSIVANGKAVTPPSDAPAQ
ncbi:MAG TPA: thioredoxin domain-containing protein [Polyangiaceae bacterium]|nr:thioredoxin domain-containing protein [Polyangiaceae bacterium]